MTERSLLSGYRVVDLSQYLPGPFATQILADLGANVIKVEPPAGDPMRHFMAPAGVTPSPIYSQLNAGKQIVRVDLKSEAGAALLARWLEKADALLESFRPGVLARLGFGPERLAQINPKLVHCALSGFGQNGPYQKQAGHDITYLSLTGGLALTGTDERPVMPYPPLADHAGAMQAAMSIMAALLRRERSGVGAHLDVSLYEAALSWQYLPLSLAASGHAEQRNAAILNGGAACYNVYRTSDDEFMALGALEDKFWQTFCAAVERPDWVARQWEALPQHKLIGDLQALFVTRTRDEWQALLTPLDCCCEPVLNPAEVMGHPQAVARGLADPQGGQGVRFPAWIDGAPSPARQPLEEVDLVIAEQLWG